MGCIKIGKLTTLLLSLQPFRTRTFKKLAIWIASLLLLILLANLLVVGYLLYLSSALTHTSELLAFAFLHVVGIVVWVRGIVHFGELVESIREYLMRSWNQTKLAQFQDTEQ